MRREVQNFRIVLFNSILTVVSVCLPLEVSAQIPPSISSPSIENPDALVREVIHNEVEAQSRDQSLWCYREQQQEDPNPPKTFQVSQPKDGDLDRLAPPNGTQLPSLQ